MRRLTAEEQRFLSAHFGEALDLTPIRLGTSLGARCWSPYGGRISLVRNLYTSGQPEASVDLQNPVAASVLAHEAVHVWQRQRGIAVTRRGAVLQALNALEWFDPYAYVPHADPRNMLTEFVLGNLEQQGKIFQDYVYRHCQGADVSAFRLVAAWVRLSAGK